MSIPRGKDDLAVEAVTYAIVTLCSMTVAYPILNIVAGSFSSYTSFLMNPMMVIPGDFNLNAYEAVFRSSQVLNSYGNTIIITVLGTALTLLVTVLYAYPLSRPQLRGKAFFNTYIIITMMFSGGIIPSYFLMRSLGLLNTLASQFMPMILGAYNCILMVNFFKALPEELIEAAKVDGATDPYVLVRIILPLSKPILATITLFSAVGLWNSYFNAIIYCLRDQSAWPVQLVLREIIMAANTAALQAGGNMAEYNIVAVPVETLRYAALLVVMLPIMCVYPFLQKFFTGGVMLGAVKG